MAPSLTPPRGSRGHQRSAAMLTGSLQLIGFDIKKWPPAPFSENTQAQIGCNSALQIDTPVLIFFPLISLSTTSGLWNLCFYISLPVQRPAQLVCQNFCQFFCFMSMAWKTSYHNPLTGDSYSIIYYLYSWWKMQLVCLCVFWGYDLQLVRSSFHCRIWNSDHKMLNRTHFVIWKAIIFIDSLTPE